MRKATIMTRVMQLIFDVLRKGIHVTKRDLFYTDVKLFQDQVRVLSRLHDSGDYMRVAARGDGVFGGYGIGVPRGPFTALTAGGVGRRARRRRGDARLHTHFAARRRVGQGCVRVFRLEL